jgi:hypothetical protein
MNTDQIKGNWKQFVGKAKEKWGLTDDRSGYPWCQVCGDPSRETAQNLG